MVSDRADPVRAPLADDQAEQATARGQRADRGPLVGLEPSRDESLDPAVRVGDPEGGVAGIDQNADAVDDELEDILDGEHAGDGARRLVDRSQRSRVRGRLATRRTIGALDHRRSVAAGVPRRT